MLNYSSLLDSNLLQFFSLETLPDQPLLEDLFGLCGKPNRPNKPWRDDPSSYTEDKSVGINGQTSTDSDDFDEVTGDNSLGIVAMGDILLGSSEHEYFLGPQSDGFVNSNDSASLTLSMDTDKNSTAWQESIAWSDTRPVSMQQQSQDTFSSLFGDPLMPPTNLAPTVLIDAISLA